MEFSNELLTLVKEANVALADIFADLDETSRINTNRVLNSFADHHVSDSLFAYTTGYGYDDRGRDTLDEIFADVFGCEDAMVRHNIVNGTHAISTALFGVLRPGDVMISVTGKPYDTLDEVVGVTGTPGNGSLADYGVRYRQIDMIDGQRVDLDAVKAAVAEEGEHAKLVFIQRSKGYMNRRTLTVSEIGEIVRAVKSVNPDTLVAVDNCYGEFTETIEPGHVGADLMMGSLIKNPGGGMAETGGYIAGTKRAVELASYRLTSVGVGKEVGCSLTVLRNFYKGLFYAPHTVSQAIKTAHLAAYIFDKLGYTVEPAWDEKRSDIIQTVIMGAAEGLCAFCRGIQYGSPVDSFVTPEPWAMPGYSDNVIMAAGAFVQGSSIELSADGPVRPPYTAFMQGGLTYESGIYGILSAATEVIKEKSRGNI